MINRADNKKIMANGHTIIPIDGSELANSSLDYVRDWLMYASPDLPRGRFPTLTELRRVIVESGYELKETHDWYVTSDDDHTEIWFSGDERSEHAPSKFWFRRGSIIVLDIMQKLANQCGSFLVVDHSGAVSVLIVPDSVFGTKSQDGDGFVSVMSQRMPIIIEHLSSASYEDALFLLSQIRQALSSLYEVWRYDLYQIAHEGLPIFAQFLKHGDVRVRFLAFDLIAILRQGFYRYADVLGNAIEVETDTDTKAQMIWAIKEHIIGSVGNPLDPWTQRLRDILIILSDNEAEAQPVRLATANLLARMSLGFLTPAMRGLFIEALVQPEQYQATWDSVYSVSDSVLESIKHLMLHHRIAILHEALPRIIYAQDAHTVLRALLDNVFYGEVRNPWMSSLSDNQEAERPNRGETKFRDNLSDNWSYPINPLRISASELMPFQRKTLEWVLSLEIPWMVHSNLLQKYGFPVSRAELRSILNTGSSL